MINGIFIFGFLKVYRDVLIIVVKVYVGIGCY